MREIKFRAWDGFQKNMFDVQSLRLPHREDLSPEVYLMQYTGLKDKNGKDVYEGDRIKEADGREGEVYYDTQWARFAITDRKGMTWVFGELNDSKECEVIGNIWES